MSELTAEIRAEGKRLHALTTPGEWTLDQHFQCYIWGPQMQMIADDGCPPADEDMQITRMRGVGAALPLKHNGEFIAFAHNNFPAYEKALAEAEEQFESYRHNAAHAHKLDRESLEALLEQARLALENIQCSHLNGWGRLYKSYEWPCNRPSCERCAALVAIAADTKVTP